MKKKLIIGILASVLVVFIVLNVLWLVTWKFRYDEYAEGFTEETEVELYYMVDEDGYTYDVNKPGYLHYNGNLSISKSPYLSFLIWPKFSGETKYGIMLKDEESMYQIRLTEKGEMLEEDGYKYTEEEIEAYEKNKEEIDIFMEKAHAVWDLD